MSFVDGFIDWAHQGLLQSDEAQEYLRGRGASTEQWARHRLGFVIGDYEPEFGVDSGHGTVCLDRERSAHWCDSCRYRRWSSTWTETEGGGPKTQTVGRRILGHVVFPLTSYSGASVGFQTRSIVGKEYDSFLLTRRSEGYFFGTASAMSSIWSTGEATLVEGSGDHLILERLLTPSVLAITTSSPSMLQMKFLRRFVRRLNLCLDKDAAGRKGVRDFVKNHGTEFDRIMDVDYPCVGAKDKDPGDFWKRVGDDAFRKHFQEAMR